MPPIPPTARFIDDRGPHRPDERPGAYYVSVIDAGRYALALGPFRKHARALELVRPVRLYAIEHDGSGRSSFAGFGTCRLELADDNPAGQLNDRPELAALAPELELEAVA